MKLEGSTDAKRAGVASRDCSRVAEHVEDSDTHRDDGAGIRDVYGVTVGLVNVGIAFEGKRKITKARIGNLVGHCQSGIEPVRKVRDCGVVGSGGRLGEVRRGGTYHCVVRNGFGSSSHVATNVDT